MPSPLCRLAVPFLCAAATPHLLPAQCQPVLDINQVVSLIRSSNPSGNGGSVFTTTTGPGGITVSSFTKCGSSLFFAASTEPTGIELWKTDGTTAGTVLVKDINPGIGDSKPALMLCCNNTLYFSADDGTHGRELWKSNGTAAGTVLVKDILNGSSSGGPSRLVCMGGQVYFGASWNLTGFWGLWKTNGTAAGTVEILSSTGGHVPAPDYLKPNSNGTEIYFQAYGALGNRRLWKTNGTSAGTMQILPSVGLSLSTPRYFHNHGGVTIFSGSGTGGIEPWTTDGTQSGTNILKNINPNSFGSGPDLTRPGAIGSDFFFGVFDGNPSGKQLWKTNGTSAGTVLAGLVPGGGYVEDLHVSGSTLFFTALDINGRELWKYSGGSISFVKDVFPGGFGSAPRNFASIGSNSVVFTCSNATFGTELWISNGTSGGTFMVKDIYPGPGGSRPEWMTTVASNAVVFVARDATHGKELWVTDGTTAGTQLLKDIDPVSTTQSAKPTWLTCVDGNTLFCSANDGVNGPELWKTDAAGSSMVKDIEPGPLGSIPRQINSCWVGGREVTFFVATTTAEGRELWITDGTGSGTTLLVDINPGSASSSISDLTCCNDRLYFAADNGVNGKELWVSDGTAGGTQMLKDILPGAAGGIGAGSFVCCRDWLFFAADDGSNGTELWCSNGSALGTQMLVDIEPGAGSSTPSQITCAGNRIVFSATTTAQGTEPWASDGTAAGTTILADIAFLAAGSSPAGFTHCDGTTFFTAANSAVGNELWKTDGTPGGTTFVKDIFPGSSSSTAGNFVCCGGQVYFAANKGNSGVELWVSDGTAPGTVQVMDINPGFAGSSPSNFLCTGNRIYFTAFTAAAGSELWTSDGTAGGTALVCDYVSGAGSSGPQYLTPCNGVLYFAATDTVIGEELFSMPLPGAMVEVLGQGCPPFVPTIHSNAPALGGTLTIVGEATPPGHIGLIGQGFPTSVPFTTPFTGSCAIWINTGLPINTLGPVITTSSWSRSYGVPTNPALTGLTVILQVFYLNTAGGLPDPTSNGLHITLGN